MLTKVFVAIVGCLLGLGIGYVIFFNPSLLHFGNVRLPGYKQKQVIGFLTYWLTVDAKKDYSPYITTLAYFGVTIGSDGSLVKLDSQTEEEPGWYALESGKISPFLSAAKNHNEILSLVAFTGDNDAINQMIADPASSSANFMHDVLPVMHKYGFTDLNLDIENTQTASKSAQKDLALFIKDVRVRLPRQNTLTLEISPTDLIRNDLINPASVASYANNIVLMAYDYHSTSSDVTGPVAPLYGAGTLLEYDTQSAVDRALNIVPSSKLILGIPLYGYEWETLNASPHSAIIPNTGLIASAHRVEQFLQNCATCSAKFDSVTQEPYISYFNTTSGDYHQIFYPDTQATREKVQYAKQMNLSGLALWALGYEGSSTLQPLSSYIGY